MKRASQSAESSMPPMRASRAGRVRVAIIRAEYNSEITQRLEEKCVEGLVDGGCRRDHIESITVPGCFEIPLVASRLAAQSRFDALIAIGAVIQGKTLHFELVANECARGVMEVSLRHGVPVIFEVLATRNRRDALKRAGNNRWNKGFEAARAALATIAALDRAGE